MQAKLQITAVDSFKSNISFKILCLVHSNLKIKFYNASLAKIKLVTVLQLFLTKTTLPN